MNTDKHGWNKTENENLICVYRCSSVAPMAGMKKCRDDSRHSRQDCPRHGGFDVLTALLASPHVVWYRDARRQFAPPPTLDSSLCPDPCARQRQALLGWRR